MDWLWNPDHVHGRELRDDWIAMIGALVLTPLAFIIVVQLGTRLVQGHWAWYWAWWPF